MNLRCCDWFVGVEGFGGGCIMRRLAIYKCFFNYKLTICWSLSSNKGMLN